MEETTESEWQTSRDNKELGIEGIRIDVEDGVATIQLTLESLECKLSLAPTLEPVLSKNGELCDRATLTAWVNKNGTDPWLTDTVMTLEDIRPSKFHEAIVFAWFKKRPDLFVIGENFLSLFNRSIDNDDFELMAALLRGALLCKVEFDAMAMLNKAYNCRKINIFTTVFNDFIVTERKIDKATIQNMLFSEVQNGRLDWVRAILDRYTDCIPEIGGALLHSAVSLSQVETVRYLCGLPGVRQIAVTNATPLYLACKASNREIVNILLAHDAVHINTLTGPQFNDTPLCVAAEHADRELVITLLGRGANIDFVGRQKRTPFLVAVAQAANELIRYFIDNFELNWNALDNEHNSVVNLACQTHNAIGLRYILDNMPDASRQFLYNHFPGNDTVLGWAIKSSQPCAEVLIEFGIGLFSVANEQTPQELAQTQSRIGLAQRIKQYYLDHPREILLHLLHMNAAPNKLFKDWFALKKQVIESIVPYVKTFSRDNPADVEELALIKAKIADPQSLLQLFFQQKNSGLVGWLSANPYPEQLSNGIAPYLDNLLSSDDDVIAYDN